MEYSDSRFDSMQADAIKRVREMQRRSKSLVNGNPEGETVRNNVQQNPHPKRENPPPIQDLLGGLLNGKGGELFNLGGIKIDEERAMIGLLIYILYKQGADIKLLLGLGYLLL